MAAAVEDATFRFEGSTVVVESIPDGSSARRVFDIVQAAGFDFSYENARGRVDIRLGTVDADLAASRLLEVIYHISGKTED